MNKYLKRATISLIVLLTMYVGLRIYLNKMLKSIVISQVAQLADKDYELKIGTIKIGWWALNANISSIKFSKINTKKNSNDPFHFVISADKIKLEGMQLLNLMLNHQIELKNIVLYNPAILISFNDTIPKILKFEDTTAKLNFKFSNIEMRDARIEINKSSGENLKLNSRLLTYNIKQGIFIIEQTIIKGEGSNQRDFDFNCNINKASLKGFELNKLINESNFTYNKFTIDSVSLSLEAQKYALNKLDTVIQSNPKKKGKSNFIIHPIEVNHLQFHNQLKNGEISASGNFFKYDKNQLQLNEIKLNIKQQNVIDIKIKQIAINGFNADNFLENQHTSIEKITLVNPIFTISVSNEKSTSAKAQTYENDAPFSIDSIRNFEIKNGNLSLTHQTDKNLKLEVKSINLSANGLNPKFKENLTNTNLVSNLFFQIGATNLNFPNNNYHVTLNNAAYNLQHEMATVVNLRIIPNYDKRKFHAVVKKQVAMINLELKTLFAKGFNLNDLINNHRFNCNEIIAKELLLSLYKDKNIPLLASDYKKLPQELIHGLKYPVQVQKLTVKDAEIISEILNSKAKNIALIKVDKVQATFNHIDNNIYEGNTMEVIFEGRIASSGLLKARAILDMFAKNYKHIVHAEISSMPFKHLNEFMFDYAGVEITNGIMDKAILDITGNNKSIHCKLALSYHDLNMVILKNQNKNNKSSRKIASMLANVLIYNNNPEKGKPLRISTVDQEYISNKFVIGNWISTGLKALILTTAPSAAGALQIEDSNDPNNLPNNEKKPNLLNRLLGRKKVK